jgi:hypothetical protein
MPSLPCRLTLAACAAVLTLSAHAAVQNVDVGTPLPRIALLKPGTHHYLRFLRVPASGASQLIDIWTREVRFDRQGGKERLHIVQRWDGVLPAPSVRTFDSWFEAGTFRPLSHERILDKDGKRTVEGFVFAPDKITGFPDVS